MESKLIIKSDSGDSATTLSKVQETGRVAITECLTAMGIPKKTWSSTYVQVHVMLLPTNENIKEK